ncbi:phage portal protein [Bacillus benzoevorans]|uniref:A118 family predicted phage portal protein n=1 Tax=Bacillus benzoevorans TaxID=1456 RepID=A0A7X0LW95_9BACI|nr:phage portal protein [Bacillus benzoevorans]MBB6446473.1 A118 family predicted phage portal protein [Bacillus benzoevorans]
MFETIKSFFRKVGEKMGLIKNIKALSDIKSIPVDDQFYQLIDQWKAIYQGYFSEFHDVKYMTINGQKKRRRATLNMPKVLSQEMATIIFNERCEINISDEGLSGNIESVLDDNHFTKKFQDYLEFQFALGGMVVKPYFDADKIKLSFVTADCFVPMSWDNKGINESVFLNQIRKRDKRYTHLEFHIWENKTYVIKNELYESQNDADLGVKVPLSTLFPDVEEEVRIEGFKRASFVYFKPNLANNIDMSSPLGIPLFANSLDTLKTIDIAFDSFQREFALGKKRILVPQSAVRTVVDPMTGQLTRYFDADDEVYEAMNFEMDSDAIKDISVELRVEEHIAAINAMLNLLSMQTGFSSGSFSFDGKSVKTATEVVSENSKTFRTKQSHENVIEAGITELIEVIVQLAELYGVFDRPADEWKVTVTFDDSIAEDQGAEITKQIQLVSNGLTTKKKAIMRVHGFTEEEAELTLREIREEQATALAESVDFFGVNK